MREMSMRALLTDTEREYFSKKLLTPTKECGMIRTTEGV